MKGLLLKEWYEAVAYGKTVFGASLIMLVISAVLLHDGGTQGIFVVYACFLMGMFPMTLLAYDETFGWTTYSYALPVSKTQLVSVKYLTALLCTFVSSILSMILLSVFCGGQERSYIIFLLTEAVTAPLISNAILLPLSYRFGSTKARYVYFVIIALFAGLLGIGVSGDGLTGSTLSPVIPLGCLAAALLLFLLSWRLSIAWYGKSRP